MSGLRYQLYSLTFTGGVHFGQGTLDQTGYTFRADTLFSALCFEAIADGSLDKLVDFAKAGDLLLSDSFPYLEDTLYLPKPYLKSANVRKEDDVSKRKLYKNLTFLPVNRIDAYLEGSLNDEDLAAPSFGKRMTKVSASIRGEEETVPYRVGVYYFNPKAGLYIIVGTRTEEIGAYFEKLLASLSYSGIGGKRSSGLGRFTFERVPEEQAAGILERLDGEYSSYMTLSVGLPAEEEMEAALDGSRYETIRLSGFVYSESYADEFHRKKDLYAFKAGSCFTHRFEGIIADVSSGGRHPVYQYANPLFMGVVR